MEDAYKNIYCANCSERGHIIKECFKPITSFGIIAFKVVNSKLEEEYDKNEYLTELCNEVSNNNVYPKIKFLMIQRKDTMGYIDLIRGKYYSKNNNNKERIQVCINEITFNEKNNLLTQSFDTIWNNMWINHDSRCYKNEYESAKRKFEQLDIKQLLDNSRTLYYHNEIGFAKGRRNNREQNIICAEREFKEETGFSKLNYDFINNYPTIQEEFIGTNNVKYRHTYYLVKMKSGTQPPKININDKIQTGEVSNIGWLTYNECISLIRPYDIEKKKILSKVNKDILNMNFKYNLSNYYTNPKKYYQEGKKYYSPNDQF